MNPLRPLREPRGVAIALATALLVPMLATATSRVDDPDVWSLATIGRDWISHGEFIRENFYSFTDPHRPWITHEWVPCVISWMGLTQFGPAFFAVDALLVLAATYAAAFRATLARKNLVAGAVLSLATLAFAKRLLSARPLAISLLLAVVLAQLAFGKRFGPRRAATCVGLVWLWANMHGSFPLGVAILVGGACQAWWAGDRKTLRLRALAIVGAAAATFANPYGATLHTFVFHHLFGDSGGAISASHTLVSEFAPVWRDRTILGPPEWIGAALILALALAGLTRREHVVRGLFAVALAALAALHVRHVEQFGFLSAVILAPVVDSLWPPARDATSVPAERARPVRWIVLPPLVLALIAFAIVASRRTREEWLGEWLGGPSFAMLTRALPDGARVHAPYASDGLVLWLAAPRGVRVFFDPRADGYAPDVALAGVEIAQGVGDVAAALSRYHTTHVITRVTGALRARLDARWRTTAASGEWVLLELTPAALPGPRE